MLSFGFPDFFPFFAFGLILRYDIQTTVRGECLFEREIEKQLGSSEAAAYFSVLCKSADTGPAKGTNFNSSST